MQELIKVNGQNYEGAKKIVQLIGNENAPLDEKEFSELLYQTFAADIAFNPNNSLLQEMINTGRLKDISNNKLRIRLTNWISAQEDISKQEHELAVQREKVLDMFHREEYSIRTVFDLSGVSEEVMGLSRAHTHISNLGLLQSVAFENNILLFMLTTHATEVNHYLPLMEDMDFILTLINAEIK